MAKSLYDTSNLRSDKGKIDPNVGTAIIIKDLVKQFNGVTAVNGLTLKSKKVNFLVS